MRVELLEQKLLEAHGFIRPKTTTQHQDPFALDLRVHDIRFGSYVEANGLGLSQTCTRLCYKEGTQNSFCC